MSTGLNEATCVIKSQFVCAVKYKQAAVGLRKKKKKNWNQVYHPGSLGAGGGGLVQTSPLEEKPQEPLG